MLRLLVMEASVANCAGGLVLIATWATMWQLATDRLRPRVNGRSSAC